MYFLGDSAALHYAITEEMLVMDDVDNMDLLYLKELAQKCKIDRPTGRRLIFAFCHFVVRH